ncbi:MAG TPA: tetratricopeptide repeat protein [Pyrinomonadaceae bacterium]
MPNLPSLRFGHTHWIKIFYVLALCFFLVSTNTTLAKAQQPDAERSKAFELFEQRKLEEAIPLFEKLVEASPNDAALLEHFGWTLFMRSEDIKDPVARKAMRKRGREVLVRAKNAGADNPVVASMIESLPEDGGEDAAFTFSKKKEANDAMQAGEAAFAKKDFPKAIEFYQQALMLDPTLYEAALYVGDSYFGAAEQRKATEWFARAVSIDPDRETAYRYWADSLMKQTRVTEAGDKYVEAYIAEPYNRLANSGLGGWANKVGIELAHPDITFSASVTGQQNGNSTLSLDPAALKKDDKSSSAWLMYGFTRSMWVQGEFKKQYPEESTYRHSLKEEVAAIRAALKSINVEKDAKTLDPSLIALAKLDKEGLLEPYILLAKVDAGIAKDFPAYRKAHIDKLREYVTKYVLTNGGGN